MPAPNDFYRVLQAAVADIVANGYDSAERVKYWADELRKAAEATLAPAYRVDEMLRGGLAAIYNRLVERGGLFRYHKGVSRFTLDRVRPELRAELERRIFASADLIKLNRVEAIEKTLRRFAGWATSVPKGGTATADKPEVKEDVKKSLRQLPFVERRVLIDQGHKLTASLGEVLARDGRALAVRWNSHWRQAGYDYRPDHKVRDGLVYALRGNWALERGLMKVGRAGYYDEVTAFAEEPFCRCYGTWLYALRDLPGDMLTQKGAEELERARAA